MPLDDKVGLRKLCQGWHILPSDVVRLNGTDLEKHRFDLLVLSFDEDLTVTGEETLESKILRKWRQYGV